MTLHWTTDERTGAVETVTLVALVVENSMTVPVRVRVGNRLDGGLRAPRRHGLAEAGWDEGGFEGVVGAGERRPLGYAVAADETESPPAEIVWTERAPETEESSVSGATRHDSAGGLDIEPTAASVVRALGDARPPADAVPTPDRAEIPDAVKSWLSAVETRIERYETGDKETRGGEIGEMDGKGMWEVEDGEMREVGGEKMGEREDEGMGGGGTEKRTVAEQAEEQELRRRIAADERTLEAVANRVQRVRERVESTEKSNAVGGTR